MAIAWIWESVLSLAVQYAGSEGTSWHLIAIEVVSYCCIQASELQCSGLICWAPKYYGATLSYLPADSGFAVQQANQLGLYRISENVLHLADTLTFAVYCTAWLSIKNPFCMRSCPSVRRQGLEVQSSIPMNWAGTGSGT